MNRTRSASVGGDEPCTTFVRNEMLAYACNAYNNDPLEAIKQTLLDFYEESAIHDAKVELWRAYNVYLPNWIDRLSIQGTPQCVKEVGDTLRAIGDIDKRFAGTENLPYVFVAVNLRNLPPINPPRNAPSSAKQDDMVEILSRLEKLERHIMMQRPEAKSRPTYAQAVADKTGTRMPADNIANAPKREEEARSAIRREPGVRRDDTASSSLVVDLLPTNYVRRDDDERASSCPRFRRRRHAHRRGDRLGKRRKREYTTGTRTATKLTSAPRRYDLFLFRLNKEATDDEIRDFVDDESMNVVPAINKIL